MFFLHFPIEKADDNLYPRFIDSRSRGNNAGERAGRRSLSLLLFQRIADSRAFIHNTRANYTVERRRWE